MNQKPGVLLDVYRIISSELSAYIGVRLTILSKKIILREFVNFDTVLRDVYTIRAQAVLTLYLDRV